MIAPQLEPIIGAVLLIAVLLRYGMLAAVVAGMLGGFSTVAATPDWGAWHSRPALLCLTFVALLAAYAKVGDVAVFGIPHEDWGEEVKAVVEPAPGAEAGDLLRDEILDFCRDRLARFKMPRSIDFMDELPRDPNGKLYKRRLRDPYWEGRERAI